MTHSANGMRLTLCGKRYAVNGICLPIQQAPNPSPSAIFCDASNLKS